MKASRFWAFTAIVAVSLGAWVLLTAQAQQPPAGQVAAPAAGGPRIALLDVGRIMKNHARFNAMLEQMRVDFENFKTQATKERNDIGKLAQELQELKRGTPEYSQREEALAKQQANWSLQTQLQQKEFKQRQAKTVSQAYNEIAQVAEAFRRQHSIDVIFRFNGEPADLEQPESVMSSLAKPVVAYDPGLDITNMILQQLNRGAPATPAQPGAAPARQNVPFGQ